MGHLFPSLSLSTFVFLYLCLFSELVLLSFSSTLFLLSHFCTYGLACVHVHLCVCMHVYAQVSMVCNTLTILSFIQLKVLQLPDCAPVEGQTEHSGRKCSDLREKDMAPHLTANGVCSQLWTSKTDGASVSLLP